MSTKPLRYLALGSGVPTPRHPLQKQLQELEIRANFIRRVAQNPDHYIDPVLRHHLGLDQPRALVPNINPKPK